MASENILQGKKILIVDDEVDILESLERRKVDHGQRKYFAREKDSHS
jgi:hypoxanthine phosphoribosyltransferase